MDLIVNGVNYGAVERVKQDRGKAWVFVMENLLQVRVSFSVIKSFTSSGVYELVTRAVDEREKNCKAVSGRALKPGERKVQIIAGLTGEYEVIVTDAPREVIEAYIIASNLRMELGEVPNCGYYQEIESKGYRVEVLGTQDEIEDVSDCVVFDRYHYNEDGEQGV